VKYVTVRLNEQSEHTAEDGRTSLQNVIDRQRYWTSLEPAPSLEAGWSIVGIGSHGGSGMFILGVVASSEWERAATAPWTWRIPVAWADEIHETNDLVGTLDGVGYSQQSWGTIDREEYSTILSRLYSAPALA
jgi:hypothetical protein